MGLSGRYEDRLQDTSSILKEITELYKAFNSLKNNTSIKNAVQVVRILDDIQNTIWLVEMNIDRDFRAHWIDTDEYNILVCEIEKAKELLITLGWDGGMIL